MFTTQVRKIFNFLTFSLLVTDVISLYINLIIQSLNYFIYRFVKVI